MGLRHRNQLYGHPSDQEYSNEDWKRYEDDADIIAKGLKVSPSALGELHRGKSQQRLFKRAAHGRPVHQRAKAVTTPAHDSFLWRGVFAEVHKRRAASVLKVSPHALCVYYFRSKACLTSFALTPWKSMP